MRVSEHSPKSSHLQPPPLTSACRDSTTTAKEINALFLPVRAKGPEPAALHFQIDTQPKQVNTTPLVLTLRLSADFGRYCVIQKMK